jgi:hypothetical protein
VFKNKADGKIKEKKPLVVTPSIDRGRGKFNVSIFSLEMNVFQGFLDLQYILSRF